MIKASYRKQTTPKKYALAFHYPYDCKVVKNAKAKPPRVFLRSIKKLRRAKNSQ